MVVLIPNGFMTGLQCLAIKIDGLISCRSGRDAVEESGFTVQLLPCEHFFATTSHPPNLSHFGNFRSRND